MSSLNLSIAVLLVSLGLSSGFQIGRVESSTIIYKNFPGLPDSALYKSTLVDAYDPTFDRIPCLRPGIIEGFQTIKDVILKAGPECVVLYQEPECRGEGLRITDVTPIHAEREKLWNWSFIGTPRSFRLC